MRDEGKEQKREKRKHKKPKLGWMNEREREREKERIIYYDYYIKY